MIVNPSYELDRNKKEICTNIKLVIDDIKIKFPNETYQSLANRAFVSIQTISRWVSVGRAEANSVRRLMDSFKNEENFDSVLLKDASPSQLKRQCEIIGWARVLSSKL